MGELTSKLAVVEFIPGSELARIDFQSAGQVHNNFEFAALDAALRVKAGNAQ